MQFFDLGSLCCNWTKMHPVELTHRKFTTVSETPLHNCKDSLEGTKNCDWIPFLGKFPLFSLDCKNYADWKARRVIKQICQKGAAISLVTRPRLTCCCGVIEAGIRALSLAVDCRLMNCCWWTETETLLTLTLTFGCSEGFTVLSWYWVLTRLLFMLFVVRVFPLDACYRILCCAVG